MVKISNHSPLRQSSVGIGRRSREDRLIGTRLQPNPPLLPKFRASPF